MASKRDQVKLRSSESSFCYYTKKNRVNTTERIVRKKYDPIVRKHVEFKETK